MSRRFYGWIVRNPAMVLLFLFGVTLALGLQMKRLVMDPDVTKALPQDLPAKRLYDRMGEIFPSKEFILVAYAPTDSVFTPQALRNLQEITRDLEGYGELQSVISPTNVRIIRGTDEGMEVSEAMETVPATPGEMAAYRERLYSDPVFVKNLVSPDHRAAGIMLFLRNNADPKAFTIELIDYLEAFRERTGEWIFPVGKPVVNYYISQGISHDMSMFFTVGIVLMFVVLLLIFRSIRGVVLPMVVVIASIVWALGLMAILGVPLSHSTELLPILLMAIGIADSIHILAHYYQRARPDSQRRTLVEATMEHLTVPVVLTSVTTAVGFLALNTSNMDSLAQLGIFSAFGVMVAMFWSLTFVPAALSMLPVRLRGGWREDVSPLGEAMARYGEWLVGHRGPMLGAILVVVLVSVAGVLRLRVESSSIEKFPPDHPLRQAALFVNDHFAGTDTFQIVLEGDRPGQMKSPRVLAAIDSLERFAAALPGVGNTQSLADMVRRMNQVMNGGDPAWDRIPGDSAPVRVPDPDRPGTWETITVDGDALIAQYLQLYELSSGPEEFANFVDFDYQNAKITVFMNTDRNTDLARIDASLTGFLRDHLPDVTAEVTGMAKLTLVVSGMVVRGQALSIVVSLGLVWLLTAFFFRSPLLGLYNIVPLFFSVFLNFAIMGWTHIHLAIETMVTASLAIGVGVDYAIHFIHRYRSECRRTGTHEDALPLTMRTSGVAILFNSLTVALGFGVIGLSAFLGVREMGVLLGLTMVTTAFAALTINPVLFSIFRPRALLKEGREGAES